MSSFLPIRKSADQYPPPSLVRSGSIKPSLAELIELVENQPNGSTIHLSLRTKGFDAPFEGRGEIVLFLSTSTEIHSTVVRVQLHRPTSFCEYASYATAPSPQRVGEELGRLIRTIDRKSNQPLKITYYGGDQDRQRVESLLPPPPITHTPVWKVMLFQLVIWLSCLCRVFNQLR